MSINATALEPLYTSWEEPTAHRTRAEKAGDPAKVVKGRRPSPIQIVQGVRAELRQWREALYAGASDTTITLLNHWFFRSHRRNMPSGEEFDFRYYFCQREAIEALVYLKEIRGINVLSQIIDAFGGPEQSIAALGVTEAEDAWTRYAFKMATGSGKTKVMSLAMVWSYFHALRESESDMAKHFVVIAPNLTVYERLKEDFGDGKVFDADPLIPSEWRGDWNMSVVLQDEVSGAATGGTLYLTNIHRLYDPEKKSKKNDAMYDWMGPAVSKGSALDTGAALRDRITSHKRVMVLNDEAHHVWDPDSAWNDAVRYIHETVKLRHGGDGGIVAQLDFSATPKDEQGQLFKHIVCDTPLGEAVDAGIVKTPIIGQSKHKLTTQADDNAAFKYDMHLRIGYERWKLSKEEWSKSGKKPLLFVMCEDTDAADQITHRLNSDDAFKLLNGTTLNLHTNLKGKLKKIGKSANARMEFVEDDKAIKDEDLKALRQLSRDLDSNASPYNCIVSVLMLREGWDVRNVTTIVPLRPLTAKANILPEQTLGRGLRRMTPPGQANEIVAVVEHPAFAELYTQELAQQGLFLDVVDIDEVPRTTISIFPDEAHKDFTKLQIALPTLSGGFRILPKVEDLSIEDVKKEFKKYKPLPLGEKGSSEIEYEGKQLLTGEIIEKLTIHIELLKSGFGAISYYVKQLEMICRLRGTHTVLAPLVETFLTEILFGKKTDLNDPALVSRLGDSDVGEHVRAVFVPLIRARTTKSEQRTAAAEPTQLSQWRPFQVTHSEHRPALAANRTLFNLIPCNRQLEVAVAKFLDEIAKDVAAFAKNAGPQSLRIDYLASGGRLAFYTPDFFVRTKDGTCFLVETKGREDRDVPRKARAAIAWCEAASTPAVKWQYLYVPQGVFEKLSGDTMASLASTCAPALQNLIESEKLEAEAPLFAPIAAAKEERAPEAKGLIDQARLDALSAKHRQAVEQAAMLFRFFENKPGINYAPVFTALLGSIDEAVRALLHRRLDADVPATVDQQKAWFAPYMNQLHDKDRKWLEGIALNLKKTLVFNNGLSPIGLLRNCLDFALNDNTKVGGVFDAVRTKFKVEGGRKLLAAVDEANKFRNTYVAHQDAQLTDTKLAEKHLKAWVEMLAAIATA